MKLQFAVACFFSFIAMLLFSDLSHIYTVVKIPIRMLSLIAIILPIYIFVRSYISIRAVIFKKSLSRESIISIIQTVFIFGVAMFCIRYLTYESSLLTFGKSLHYGDYFILYLTLGYMSHVFLQDLLIVLIYEGFELLTDKKRGNIIIVSLLFGVAHLFMGIATFVLTSIGGMIFLYIYVRFHNILAVNIMHYSLGLIAISFGWA